MDLCKRLENRLKSALNEYPFHIIITDYKGNSYDIGLKQAHWYNQPLHISFHTKAAIRDALNLNGLGVLERFVNGEVDVVGNFYILTPIRMYANVDLTFLQYLGALIRNYLFQNVQRASKNVKSHYDIRQDILEVYLDKVYMAYSCAMFEDPNNLNVKDVLKVGKGKADKFDSLEKAQWRKFKDAIDFVNPKEGETLLDIGCGYGGQLLVGLEERPFGKVVGWTHSTNQKNVGSQWLSKFDQSRWELNEGDYREDKRVYDHITSCGMISHIGPRALTDYVRQVRKRIKNGGRYMHHCLMTKEGLPLDREAGAAFNKKYVWPGFHWFTLGQHISTLERNGFRIRGVNELSPHYAKTVFGWYERMMDNSDWMKKEMGEKTFRAWQVYLGGGVGSHIHGSGHVARLYCEAI